MNISPLAETPITPLKYGFKYGVAGGSYDALILIPFFSMASLFPPP